MLDKIELSPVANSTNSFVSSADDTFSRARSVKANSKQLPAWAHSRENFSMDGNTSNIFDKSNPVHPSEGITSFTPIKSLVSSPFRSSHTSPRRNDNLTYDDPTLGLTSMGTNGSKKVTEQLLDVANAKNVFFGDNQKRYSSLKQKVQQKEKFHQHQLQVNMTPKKQEDTTLFSQIYDRSVFRSRRTTLGATPLLSANNTLSSSFNKNVDHEQQSKTRKTDNNIDLSSPYMKMALKRLINKKYEVGRLLICSLLFLFYRLICAIVALLRIKIELRSSFTQSRDTCIFTIITYVNYAIYAGLLFNILIAIIRLLKPQDKCLDLPLTDGQRKVLGLPLIHGSDDTDMDEQSIIRKAETKEGPPILKYSGSSNRSILDTDISRSFADMNISRFDGLSQSSGSRALLNSGVSSVDKIPSSPEKIKERLLSAHKQYGGHYTSLLDRSLNTSSFVNPNSFDRTSY